MISTSPAEARFTPRAALFFLSFYLLAIAGCIAVPRALSFLPTSVALVGLLYLYLKQRALPAFDKNLLWFFLGFGALACISHLWAPDPDYSLGKATKTSILLLSGLLPVMMARAIPFDMQGKRKLLLVCVVTCAVAGLYIAFEYATRYMILRTIRGLPVDEPWLWPPEIGSGFLLNRSSVFLVMLCLPLMLALRTSSVTKLHKNLLSLLLLFSIGLVLITTQSQTAIFAAILAVPMLVFPAQKSRARIALLVSLLFAMIAAPFVVPAAKQALLATDAGQAKAGFMIDASIPHRMEVWTFMSEQIMKAPILGHGIESARSLRAGYIMPHMKTDQVMHPHNAVLQIWLEYGVVGLVIVMGFVCYLFFRLDNMPAIMQRYHIVFFIVLLSVLSMSYDLWQAWLVGMIQTLVALGLIAGRLTGVDGSKPK